VKQNVKIVLCGLALVLVSARSLQANPEKHVTLLPTRGETFCFKVDREFIGAEVEIVDLYGTPIGATKVMGKRMLIDLSQLTPDSYVIRIKKNDTVFEYRYIKTSLGLFKL